MTSTWQTRYPDLSGKAAIVAGDDAVIVDVARELAANAVLLALVSNDRSLVTDATAVAEAAGVAVFGMTTDPSSPAVWDRITQHIEQRLGPIDIAVALGSPAVASAMRSALVPDMIARHRGVFVEIGAGVGAQPIADGVRHRCLANDPVALPEIGLVVLHAVSDTTTDAALNYPG